MTNLLLIFKKIIVITPLLLVFGCEGIFFALYKYNMSDNTIEQIEILEMPTEILKEKQIIIEDAIKDE